MDISIFKMSKSTDAKKINTGNYYLVMFPNKMGLSSLLSWIQQPVHKTIWEKAAYITVDSPKCLHADMIFVGKCNFQSIIC